MYFNAPNEEDDLEFFDSDPDLFLEEDYDYQEDDDTSDYYYDDEDEDEDDEDDDYTFENPSEEDYD